MSRICVSQMRSILLLNDASETTIGFLDGKRSEKSHYFVLL